jgi:RNA 3'-terminal phosphate cyclase (ATP)
MQSAGRGAKERTFATMADMLTIDGSQGECGGQVLRSSLALLLVTGRPFTIENIRAGRKEAGLLRQHLTAVLAAVEVSGAEVKGAILGSPRVVFHPSGVRPGDYAFRIGTAGSIPRAGRSYLRD